MKNIILPSSILIVAMLISACEDASQVQNVANKAAEAVEVVNETVQKGNDHIQQGSEALSSGSVLSIVRDVADLQLKASDHITAINETKTQLENAVNNKDAAALATAIELLDSQLKSFNLDLDHLNLKSEEIDQIRQKILDANTRVLESPLLNQQIDLNKINLNELEKQMDNIEGQMLKLAAVLIENNEKS